MAKKQKPYFCRDSRQLWLPFAENFAAKPDTVIRSANIRSAKNPRDFLNNFRKDGTRTVPQARAPTGER